jgi:hypothetical protein
MSEKPTYRYTDEELVRICSVDNDWAATELGERLNRCRRMLMRCSTVLNHMAVERQGFWAQLFKGRWMISDEPLRNDAQHLLPLIGDVMRTPEEIYAEIKPILEANGIRDREE